MLDRVAGESGLARVRRVLSNSLGFGGSDGRLILVDPGAGNG